jgi:hypothetical protein
MIRPRRTYLDATTAELLGSLDTVINKTLQVTVQTTTEVLVEGRTTRQDDVLVQTTTNVNGARLNDSIDDLRQRSQEIAAEDLGVEENFRAQESLVTNIN